MSKNHEYEIFFTIEERGPEDSKGHKAKVLIDNKGYLCGIFATYRHAKEAMPRIRSNMIADYKRKAKKQT
jgi:ribosomal protein L20